MIIGKSAGVEKVEDILPQKSKNVILLVITYANFS
jgi:hypothetical protein